MYSYLKGRKFIFVLVALALVIFAIPYFPEFIGSLKPSDKWSISEDGLVSYPESRGAVEYTRRVLNDTPEFTLSKIVYKSKGEKIYALLRVPKNTGREKMPALILLPGAGMTKEAEQNRAEMFQKFGYITLAIDERGNIGETKGGALSMDGEYMAFSNNAEPVQHKMVFDVLRAYDFLAEQDNVDPKNIAVFGESMGGRLAIIAGAIEPKIKGVVVISTSGYGSLSGQFLDENARLFLKSIDPDAYIGKISPRALLAVHSTNDTVIPIDSARATFSYAKEPKKFITVDYRTHGWASEMAQALKEETGKIFSGQKAI